MSLAAALLALAAIASSGTGLVRLGFERGPTSRGERALRLALAAALGTGAWATAFVAALFVLGSSAGVVVGKDVALVLGGVALGLVARRRRPDPGVARDVASGESQAPTDRPSSLLSGESRAPTDRPSSLLVGLVLLVAVLVAALLVERRLAHPEGSWDAIAIWNQRARFLRRGEGRAFLRAFAPENAHADYPLLLPACVAQGWRWLGESPDVAFGVGALALAVAVAVAGLAVARRRGRDAGLGLALVLLGAPSLVTLAAAQIADVPLVALVSATLALVTLALEESERRRERLALAGLAAGFGALTKNEGELFLVAVALALAVTRRTSAEPRRDSLRRALIFGVGALPPLLVLAWQKLALAPRNDIVAGLGGALERLTDGHRALLILKSAGEEAVRLPRWGLGVLASPLVVLVLGRERPWREPAARLAGLVTLVVAAGFFAVYLVTPLDLAWHLDHSLERLAAQLLPAWLLFVFLSLPGEKPRDLV